jgi:prepilin-type N-terminal cleavage/methylation domain-containing protein
MWEETKAMRGIANQPNNPRRIRKQAGFSLLEMMVVVLVLTVIMGAVFKSINISQRASRSQQIRLDLTQQAREFVDQITTDLRNSGYPYVRNMANGVVDLNNGNPAPYNTFTSAYDPSNAPGLIYVDNGSLWFSAALDGTAGAQAGTANVRIIRYDYVAAGLNCPCLRRTEFARNGGDPLADAQNPGQAVAQLEIQGVQNGVPGNPIFTVYDAAGNAIPLPVDWNSGALIAGINSLKVVLNVQSPNQDSNGERPITTVVSSIALVNCSEAMVNGQTPQFCQ